MANEQSHKIKKIKLNCFIGGQFMKLIIKIYTKGYLTMLNIGFNSFI